jgi:hypothetical protein
VKQNQSLEIICFLFSYIAALDLFDELISHILWIGGIILFCVALIRLQVASFSRHGSLVKYAKVSLAGIILFSIFGIIYGVLFACHNIEGFRIKEKKQIFFLFFYFFYFEGGTVMMGLPFSVLLVLYLTTFNLSLVRTSPLALLFFVSHIITIVLLLIWFAMWGSFPEFSQLKGLLFMYL